MLNFAARQFYEDLANEPVEATIPICPVIVERQKQVNGGLTDKEIEEGYFIDPVLGRCNIKKAMADRAEAIRREYEAFDNMHRNDGTFTVKRFSKL